MGNAWACELEKSFSTYSISRYTILSLRAPAFELEHCLTCNSCAVLDATGTLMPLYLLAYSFSCCGSCSYFSGSSETF